MRRIIEGITYNTATAVLIGEWRNTLDIKDAKWCHEILFKTQEGRYFIWGCGGTRSPYKFVNNPNHSSRTEITPLGVHEAMIWAKKHLMLSIYIKEFGQTEDVA